MDRLFAPWRMAYILMADEASCIFCELPKEDRDEENLILLRGEACFVLLNRFPYNPGHLMIAPYRHAESLSEISESESREMMGLLARMERVISEAMKPHGFNIGINMGRVAGAGFGHLHAHIVPRWSGDTNFMPVIGDVKVVSEALSETYHKLKERL
ncbi:MAG: HIT domain-containing protein [candidate division WOR-3 bacterium]